MYYGLHKYWSDYAYGPAFLLLQNTKSNPSYKTKDKGFISNSSSMTKKPV